MKFNHYPTAFEIKYRFILDNIYEEMYNSRNGFIDTTLGNNEIVNFLKEKGFTVIDIRYEYKTISGTRKYGFYGRQIGDGHIITRIIWGDVKECLEQYGDFR